MNKVCLKIAGLILALAGSAGPSALASDLPREAQPVPPPLALEGGWKFQATLYGWATAIDGDVGIKGLPPVNVNVSFADILHNLDGAVMGSFYASDGRWMVLTDVVWAKLSDQVNAGRFGGRVKFEQKQAIVSGIVGYRLPVGPENLNISATAGVRYNDVNAKLDILPAILPVDISRGGTESWVDPTVGLSVRYDINDRWFVNGLADIGGFGVGSRITAQGLATIGYNWTKTISTAIGYRAIYTDYKNGGFVYNTTQHGVFTSIAFHF